MIEQYWVGIFDVNTSKLIVQLNKVIATVLSSKKYTRNNLDARLNIILGTNLERFDDSFQLLIVWYPPPGLPSPQSSKWPFFHFSCR